MVISISQVAKSQGLPGTVKYLKAASVVTQQALAGHILYDMTSLGPRISRDKGGLPRLIPTEMRALIRGGSSIHQRYALSVLSLYRDIIIPGKIKLESITDSRSVSLQGEKRLHRLIPVFTRLFIGKEKINTSILSPPNPFVILKASPSSAFFPAKSGRVSENSSHPSSLLRALVVLTKDEHKEVLHSLFRVLSYLPRSHVYETVWDLCIS
jgi:hypothetical protein